MCRHKNALSIDNVYLNDMVDCAVFFEEMLGVYRSQHSAGPGTKRRLRIIPADHKNKGYGRLVRELLQKNELSVAWSRDLN